MSATTPYEALSPVRLGLRENLLQLSLLVVVNAFVGATVGMERSLLPAIDSGAIWVTQLGRCLQASPRISSDSTPRCGSLQH